MASLKIDQMNRSFILIVLTRTITVDTSQKVEFRPKKIGHDAFVIPLIVSINK